MNERLEKEMDKFYGIYRNANGNTFDISNYESCYDWKNDESAKHECDIAEYFYNLALKDVKKEVEKHRDLLKLESEYTTYAGGRLDETKDILDFIDQLSK